MMYADYAFYQEIYKGRSIAETDFDRLMIRAGFYLEQLTGGRVKDLDDQEAVNLAACAVAEVWQEKEQGGVLLSESVGKWSKTYAEQGQTMDKKLYEAAALYLADTGLLSRWC